MQHETSLIASLIASLVASLGLNLLLYVEQYRSLKPSDLATLYLIASILCDVVLLTLPSGIAATTKLSRPILVRCVVHLTLLLLECRGKRPISALNHAEPPEESNVILSRIFFSWINPILLRGYRNFLGEQDLPPLSRDMKPKVTRKAILQAWNQRGIQYCTVL